MSDYNLLSTLRQVISNDELMKDSEISKNIYLTLPIKPSYPCILLEIDEVWNDYTASTNQAIARINFHLNIMTQMQIGKRAIELGNFIEEVIDGRSIRLSPVFLANFRKTGNVIDLPMMKSPRVVQQFYQAVVWKKALEQSV